MKKLLLITCLLATAFVGSGQIKVAPEAGLNFSNYSVPTKSYSATSVFGVRLGLIADLALGGDKCYLQPGVLYVRNGTAVNAPSYFISQSSITYRVHTIEVPLNFLYKFGQPGKNRLFAGAGVYLGMNVKSDAFYITNYDMGGGVNAGCEFKRGLFIRATAQSGVLKPKSSGITTTSSNLAMTLGYFFNFNRTSRRSDRSRGNLMPE